jgi:trigger factor
MNIEIKNQEGSGVDRHVQISVPLEAVKDAEDKAARRYASSVRLPGFRPGKAPAQMVRKKFAEAIRQEALEALVRDAYKEVVEKQDLKVASQPHVHDLKFEEGKPLTFELHFELRPDVTLARTSGFRVTKKNPVVTDEHVRDQIDSIRDQRAAWTPVDEKPMPGDMVNVEISTGDTETSGEAKS